MNKKLEDYTDDELLKELGDRQLNISIPRPINTIHSDSIMNWCAQYIKSVLRGYDESSANVIKHFIFESVMIYLYGEDMFKMINKRLEENKNETCNIN